MARRTINYGAFLDGAGLDHALGKELRLLVHAVCNQTDMDWNEARAALRRVLNRPDF